MKARSAKRKPSKPFKVGVIAILSASPSLDTKVVEQKFREVEDKLRGYAESFKTDLGNDLDRYFQKEKGDGPSTLESFLGNKSLLSESLKKYPILKKVDSIPSKRCS